MDFSIRRCRFAFEARQALHFPPGRTANVLRGAFGRILREVASPDIYQRIFEPRSAAGAGMRDCPRPFVFRCARLDGLTCKPGDRYSLDVHLFDLDEALPGWFEKVFAELAQEGIGPGRGTSLLGPTAQEIVSVSLAPVPRGVERVRVRFLTPTELKSAGEVAAEPAFPILCARLRDRIGALLALYGPGPPFRPDWDRNAMRQVRTTKLDLQWEHQDRLSRRTGQIHPLGGFVGEAIYEGPLDPFLPVLLAGQWTGAGRQTVWGKGAIEVIPSLATDGHR